VGVGGRRRWAWLEPASAGDGGLALRASSLRMPAVGALGGLAGAQLLQVGPAVLTDETDLGLGGRGGGLGRERPGGCRGGLLVVVRSGERLHDLPVQDAQGDARHRVAVVVLGGLAVVEAGVGRHQPLKQHAVGRLQHPGLPVQLEEGGQTAYY